MYLEIFLADFAVFRVLGGISRYFAGPRPREISEALCKPPWIKALHLQCISPPRKPHTKMYKLRAQGHSQLFD